MKGKGNGERYTKGMSKGKGVRGSEGKGVTGRALKGKDNG